MNEQNNLFNNVTCYNENDLSMEDYLLNYHDCLDYLYIQDC